MRSTRIGYLFLVLSFLGSSCATSAPTERAGLAKRVDKSFVLDVSALVTKLDLLRFDEREEQIADWAVYGTLLYAKPLIAALRAATYDKVPLRLPGLDEAFHFDY